MTLDRTTANVALTGLELATVGTFVLEQGTPWLDSRWEPLAVAVCVCGVVAVTAGSLTAALAKPLTTYTRRACNTPIQDP
jgi:hypothetical protein